MINQLLTLIPSLHPIVSNSVVLLRRLVMLLFVICYDDVVVAVGLILV